MFQYLKNNLPQIWQDKTHPVSKLAYPLSLLYGLVISVRRLLYKTGLMRSHAVEAPVVIVGNITVGGTGKTPLVIWLSEYLYFKGLKVGIISRGYGGSSPQWPVDVSPQDKAEVVGDEAVMLKHKTNLPVIVSPVRVDAARMLVELYGVDVIVSDDGLQHLALKRDLEIVVIDALRKFGNNRLLPSGPLRQTVGSISDNAIRMYSGNNDLEQFDYWMKFNPIRFRNVNNNNLVIDVNEFEDNEVNAVAGIGFPDKFFDLLSSLGIKVNKHRFPDHHVYTGADFQFNNQLAVIMTEKDAVKCAKLVNDNTWFLEINAVPNEHFKSRIDMFADSITGAAK